MKPKTAQPKQTTPSPSPRIIVAISDIHCGSLHGLCPPKFEDDLSIGTLSHVREWLWSTYEEAVSWVHRICGSDPYLLVAVGDLIEGVHHGGQELLTKSIGLQCQMASATLMRLAFKARSTIVVEGTHTHVGEEERTIADLLRSEEVPVSTNELNGLLQPYATLRMNGLIHEFRHHTSNAGRSWTELGNQGNHLVDHQQRRRRTGQPVPDVLVTGHRHVWGYGSTQSGTTIALPAWQGVTRWARQATREDVATVGLLLLDYRDREINELPDIRPFVRSSKAPRSLPTYA